MARTAMSRHILKFQCDERKLLLTYTNDSNRDEYLRMYDKTNLTTDDILRIYTPEEERMLCERTKVRVDMFKMNPVWEAKRYFDKKKRFENRSERWINKMLVKAHRLKMIQPFSDEDKTRIKEVCSLLTKKDNNVSLDIWHRQRAKASALNRLKQRSESPISISSCSDTESEPELLPESEPTSPVSLKYQRSKKRDSETNLSSPDPVPESQPDRLSAMSNIAHFRFKPSQAPLEAKSMPSLFSSDDEEESEDVQQRISDWITALNSSSSDAGNKSPKRPEHYDEDDEESPFLM